MPEKTKSDKKLAFDRKVVAPFVDALLSGKGVPWIHPIASFKGFWPQNGYSKHQFSGGNIFLCLAFMLQHELSCPLFATRKQLKDNDITYPYENKDKYTTLSIPRFGRPKTTVNKTTGEEKTWNPLCGFFYADYLNLQHTHADWEAMLPDKREAPVRDAEHAIQALCSMQDGPHLLWSSTQMMALGHGAAGGCYYPRLDRLHMHDRENYKGDGECASTLAHELAHATGHSKRLDRDMTGNKYDPTNHRYSIEEVVAEATAALLMAEFGITHTVENSVAYMQHWGEQIRHDPDIIWKAMGDAWAAKSYILSHVSLEEVMYESQIA